MPRQTGVSLEGQIDELMTGLVTAMALVEDLERQRREEQTRRWKLEQERAELERLRQIEAARWKHLLDLVAATRQAADTREFLDRWKEELSRSRSIKAYPRSTQSGSDGLVAKPIR